MDNFKRSLDKYLTSEPSDDNWWYELVGEYVPVEIINPKEWESKEKEIDQFLAEKFKEGLTPQQAAISLVKNFKSVDLPALPKPIAGKVYARPTENYGIIRSVVVNYDDYLERVLVRATSEEELRLPKNMSRMRCLPLCWFWREYKSSPIS